MTVKRLRFLLFVSVIALMTGCKTVPVPVSDEQSRDASRYNAELGAKYLQRDDLEQARIKLEKALAQDKKNADAHVSYGRLQQRVGRNKDARKHFVRAIGLKPEVAEYRNSYGVFLCEIKDYDAALTEFKKAADNPYYKTPEYALDNAGLCMLDSDNLVKAEEFLRDALRTNPRFPSALLHMSELTYRQRRLTVADAYLMRFREYSSETPQSLSLALNIQRDMGNIQVAESYANKLLGDFPTSREAGEYLARPLQ
ncbi:MAG: type IV pilus biogenesis/stability protein PilW [Gammaproteobacteria bacterium]|nr:type IV pilus biogenesis/stability protein PilW [Gammaproteobacteria bacterium]